MERFDAAADCRPDHVPADRDRHAAHLDRRRRQPRVRGPRGALRASADARDHRRHPQRFRPFVDLYQQSLERFDQPVLPVAVHSPGHVAATDEQAKKSSGRTTR